MDNEVVDKIAKTCYQYAKFIDGKDIDVAWVGYHAKAMWLDCANTILSTLSQQVPEKTRDDIRCYLIEVYGIAKRYAESGKLGIDPTFNEWELVDKILALIEATKQKAVEKVFIDIENAYPELAIKTSYQALKRGEQGEE